MEESGPPPIPLLPPSELEPPEVAEFLPPSIIKTPPPKPFPGLVQALGLIALLMGMQLLVIAAVSAIDYFLKRGLALNPLTLGLTNLVSFGVACTIAGWRAGLPLSGLLRQAPPAGTFTTWTVLALFHAVLGQIFCSMGIIYAIAGKAVEKSEYVERLNRLVGPGQSWWAVVPLLVIVAPVTEEVLFRGQFLRGFLGRYSPAVAIGLSAVLFSAIHLNPVQIPATLMLGILSGILFLRTRSVWPSIAAHMLNNSFPALAVIGASRAKPAVVKNAAELTMPTAIGLMVAGLVIWLLALHALRQWLPAAEPPADGQPEPPDDDVARLEVH